MGRERGEQRDFKELAPMVERAGGSEICRAGSRLETQGRVDVTGLSPKAV